MLVQFLIGYIITREAITIYLLWRDWRRDRRDGAAL